MILLLATSVVAILSSVLIVCELYRGHTQQSAFWSEQSIDIGIFGAGSHTSGWRVNFFFDPIGYFSLTLILWQPMLFSV